MASSSLCLSVRHLGVLVRSPVDTARVLVRERLLDRKPDSGMRVLDAKTEMTTAVSVVLVRVWDPREISRSTPFSLLLLDREPAAAMSRARRGCRSPKPSVHCAGRKPTLSFRSVAQVFGGG